MKSQRRPNRRCGFTMVEIAAALLILSMLLGSTIVLMNRYIGAVMDLRLREHAFNLARSNMEMLLTESKVSEMTETGTSEEYPDIDWQTTIEPFYEPVTDRMWIRAVCSAGFFDNQGRRQDVELEHWITGLTAAQVKQIVAQQEIETEYLDLLQGENESEIIETTRAYLEEKGLDVEAYDRFAKKQRREKVEYLSANGMEGYEEFQEELKEEENIFLEKTGMDFDEYNEFALTYVPEGGPSDNETLHNTGSGTGLGFGPSANVGSGSGLGFANPGSINKPDVGTNSKPNRGENTSSGLGANKGTQKPTGDTIPWNTIPREFWGIFESLGYNPPE